MRLWHAGCALLCLIGAPMARAGEAEDFFIGKQLKMTVGYGPGTGNDVYARHLAKYLGRHMPAVHRHRDMNHCQILLNHDAFLGGEI